MLLIAAPSVNLSLPLMLYLRVPQHFGELKLEQWQGVGAVSLQWQKCLPLVADHCSNPLCDSSLCIPWQIPPHPIKAMDLDSLAVQFMESVSTHLKIRFLHS